MNIVRRAWCRRDWLTGLAVAVTIGPLFVGEIAHLFRYGHLAAGLHADAVYDVNMIFPILGVRGAYSVELVNLTPIPIPVLACHRPSDTSAETPPLYRFRIERWDSPREAWAKVLALPAGECSPYPTVSTVLLPGLPVTAVDWEATAARRGLHKGDRVRFTVFRDFRIDDDAPLQLAATSPDVMMTDEPAEPDRVYRVAH